jgi:hypothetical protein
MPRNGLAPCSSSWKLASQNKGRASWGHASGFSPDLSDFAHCRGEQHDVNVVVVLRLLAVEVSFERPAFHPAFCSPEFGPDLTTAHDLHHLATHAPRH